MIDTPASEIRQVDTENLERSRSQLCATHSNSDNCCGCLRKAENMTKPTIDLILEHSELHFEHYVHLKICCRLLEGKVYPKVKVGNL